ncbi:transposase [bacterium]|nr:transposase [bacterium]
MRYPSDLTDREWERIRHHFEYTNGYGNRRIHSIRETLNAIFYVNKTGCQWRQLPKDFSKWKTVYSYYYRLCKRGTWEKVLDDLNQMDRKKSNRSSSPSYLIVDSQSVQTYYGGPEQGFDGGKKGKETQTTYWG